MSENKMEADNCAKSADFVVGDGEESLVELVENAVSNEDVVIISDDDSVVLVETTIDKKEESGYLAETESSVSEPETSISFGSPPDHTEYLKLLYSGQADLIPEHMRPPPRDKQFNSSTPKKEDAI